MDPSALLELTYRMLVVVLLVSAPVVAVAVLVGLVMGMLQAVTQIQDQSIAYGVKIVAAAAVIALTSGWAGGQLMQYAQQIFDMIVSIR
jgi:type III secretion protein S